MSSKHPHYQISGREKQPIELMRLGLTDAEFEGYCIGNVMKYALRYQHKGGDDDLRKAVHYLSFMMDKKTPEVDLSEAQGLWERIRIMERGYGEGPFNIAMGLFTDLPKEGT